LVAALDASGFCAFSAAGLLSDGTMGLDALAARLHPAGPGGPRPRGRALVAWGHALVGVRRELARRLGRRPSAPPEDLRGPGLFEEYERWGAHGFAAADAPGSPPAPGGASGARRAGAADRAPAGELRLRP